MSPDSDVLGPIPSGLEFPPLRFCSAKVHEYLTFRLVVANLNFCPRFTLNNLFLALYFMFLTDPSSELTYWGNNITILPPQSVSSLSLFSVCPLSTQSLTSIFAGPALLISLDFLFSKLLSAPSESLVFLLCLQMALVSHPLQLFLLLLLAYLSFFLSFLLLEPAVMFTA